MSDLIHPQSPMIFAAVATELGQHRAELLQMAGLSSPLRPILQEFSRSSLEPLLQKPPQRTHHKSASPFGELALPCFRLATATLPAPQLADELATLITACMSAGEATWTWLKHCHSLQGFVNFELQTSALLAWVLPTCRSPQTITRELHHRGRTTSQGAATKLLIEYSQPNTHKEFHVGHARNVCLGHSLSRIYQALGYHVSQVNYIGDEGTHVAKCLWQLHQDGQLHPPADKTASQWYNIHYTKAHDRLKTTPAAAAEISTILNELEARSGPYYELWRTTKQHCLDDFNAIYQWLDVTFDHVYFESDLTQEAQAIVDTYLAAGVFHHSEGTIGRDLSEQDLGYMMVRKSDGNSLYITKDLALAQRKRQDYDATHSLIIVGNEQNFHFKQLFACLKLMNIHHPQYEHVAYGMVVLKQGKMSSRMGNVVGFWELITHIDTALEQPLSTIKATSTGATYQHIKEDLTLGVLMFGMLNQDPQKKLVFDIDSFVQFEGRTGPYLMYAHTRAHKLLSKAPPQLDLTACPTYDARLITPPEKKLLLTLTEFFDLIPRAGRERSPSLLCSYLYDLCRVFSQFYTQCPIFATDTDPAVQSMRLILTHRFRQVLKHGLHLIGMNPPSQM